MQQLKSCEKYFNGLFTTANLKILQEVLVSACHKKKVFFALPDAYQGFSVMETSGN
jgi:hypothetical protein